MKISQLTALESYLKEQTPSVSLLLGSQSREALEQLQRSLGLSIEKISCDSAPQELETHSLLGEQRLLWIDEPKLTAAFEKWLVAYLERPNPHLYLALTPPSAGAALVRACDEKALLFDLPKVPPWREEEELIGWLLNIAQQEGVTLRPDAAALLVRTSTDRGQLRLELSKLISYVGGSGTIDIGAVKALCPETHRETVWDLSRAILDRRAGQALQLWRQIILRDNNPHGLLAQIRSQIQQGLRICSLLAHEGGAAAISGAFPYLKGKNLQRRIDQVRGYGEGRLRRALIALQRTDLATKNGVGDPAHLVELFIARVAG